MIGSPLLIAEKARGRLQAILSGDVDAAESIEDIDLSNLPDSTDLVITACEVNSLHGTGTLLLRIFPTRNRSSRSALRISTTAYRISAVSGCAFRWLRRRDR